MTMLLYALVLCFVAACVMYGFFLLSVIAVSKFIDWFIHR